MNLNERIYQLRTAKKMSQGDLADALDVSRQSVSKWETGAAVPELDKLIRLSEIFEITLDELIKGESIPPTKEEIAHTELAGEKETVSLRNGPTAVYYRREPRHTAGMILLIFGGAILILCSLLGGLLSGIFCSLPFFACAVVCYAFRRRVGLWCAWVVLFLVQLYFQLTSGVGYNTWIGRLRMRLKFFGDEFFEFNMHDIVSIVVFLVTIVLIALTVYSFRKMRRPLTRDNLIPFGICTGVYLSLHGADLLISSHINKLVAENMNIEFLNSGIYLLYRVWCTILYHVQYIGFTVLFVWILALIRGRQKERV